LIVRTEEGILTQITLHVNFISVFFFPAG